MSPFCAAQGVMVADVGSGAPRVLGEAAAAPRNPPFGLEGYRNALVVGSP